LRVWLRHRIEENKTHPEPLHSNWGSKSSSPGSSKDKIGWRGRALEENSKGILAAGIVHVTDKSTVGNNCICNQHIFAVFTFCNRPKTLGNPGSLEIGSIVFLIKLKRKCKST
jgi:hypothetical protein